MPLYDAMLAHSGHAILAQVLASWFVQLSAALHTLMTLAILVLVVAVVPAAWNFRKSYQKISDLLDRVYADINPLAHHASRITENIDYVTTALRADVQRASATLTDADRRLQKAIRRAEQRALDFDALLAVVQDETEGAFVSTASTVRGMRTSMDTLRETLHSTLRDIRDEVAAVPRPVTRDLASDGTLDEIRTDLAAVDVRGLTPVRSSVAIPSTPFAAASLDAIDDDLDDEPPLDDDAFDESDEDEDEEPFDGTNSYGDAARSERPRVRPRRGYDD